MSKDSLLERVTMTAVEGISLRNTC